MPLQQFRAFFVTALAARKRKVFSRRFGGLAACPSPPAPSTPRCLLGVKVGIILISSPPTLPTCLLVCLTPCLLACFLPICRLKGGGHGWSGRRGPDDLQRGGEVRANLERGAGGAERPSSGTRYHRGGDGVAGRRGHTGC